LCIDGTPVRGALQRGERGKSCGDESPG
jgi:hypothetical protein